MPSQGLCAASARALMMAQSSVHVNSRTHRRVMTQAYSRTVAVIGAGAAGLACTRELRLQGHKVLVFEQSPTVGGVWVYTPEVESDPLGTHTGHRVHTSMYQNLRTNLPREIMAYQDFPFHPEAMALATAGARSPDAHLANETILPLPGTTLPLPSHTPHDIGPCQSIDPRRYPGHEEVLRYLRAYTLYHNLLPHIQFHTQVTQVTPIRQHTTDTTSTATPPYKWRITTTHTNHAAGTTLTNGTPPLGTIAPAPQTNTIEVDAVVVCNGHYSYPNIPDLPGMERCPAIQMHSHNYRTPEPFAGKVVMVVGASNSGEDISREVSSVARKVLLSARTWKVGEANPDAPPYGTWNNIYRYPLVERLTPHGTAVFPGRLEEPVDVIIYATGYRYTFPFLEQEQGAEVTQVSIPGSPAPLTAHSHGAYVSPLYQHILPASDQAPWLSFIGLPWKVVPFPQFQIQARLVSRALSGRVALPSVEDMTAQVEEQINKLKENNTSLRYLHMQNMDQFPYNKELASLSGADVTPLQQWREAMYMASGELKRGYSSTYRDEDWSALYQSLIQVVEADVEQQIQSIKNTANWAQAEATVTSTSGSRL